MTAGPINAITCDVQFTRGGNAAGVPPTRRTTIGLGVAAAIASAVPDWRVSAQGGIADDLHARFLRWSRTATGFADLSAGAARTFMEFAFRSGIPPESLSGLAPDEYRGTTTEKLLLEAWYTGAFRTAGSPGVRSYETTLMWSAAGIDPRPGICGDGPQRWASAPSNI
jgi:hypothetical protein